MGREFICLGCRQPFHEALDLLTHLQSEHRLALFARGNFDHTAPSSVSSSTATSTNVTVNGNGTSTPLLQRQLHEPPQSGGPYGNLNPRNWTMGRGPFEANHDSHAASGVATWGGGLLGEERLRAMAAAAAQNGKKTSKRSDVRSIDQLIDWLIDWIDWIGQLFGLFLHRLLICLLVKIFFDYKYFPLLVDYYLIIYLCIEYKFWQWY